MKTMLVGLVAVVTVTHALGQAPISHHDGGPEVVVDRAASDIFPESWLTEKVSAKAEPLAQELQTPGRAIVDKALAKYPLPVLTKNLKKVYLVGNLIYSGVPTGGTNSRSAVYVVSKPKYSEAQIEGIFHAEFSSILLRNFPNNLDREAWQKVNPPTFTYLGSGVKAVKAKLASQRLNGALHEDGFLHSYSQASLEEDFNSFAGRLFMGSDALWDAVEKYPKLMTKADLVIAFYGNLDASFTKEYFLSLRQKESPDGSQRPG
ncbi:MAG: hypothetical protein KDN20_22045 [Verrucomicrobiae bacterium]|nr:hypothetical protein [Verrucomicrobiae bacterium]